MFLRGRLLHFERETPPAAYSSAFLKFAAAKSQLTTCHHPVYKELHRAMALVFLECYQALITSVFGLECTISSPRPATCLRPCIKQLALFVPRGN